MRNQKKERLFLLLQKEGKEFEVVVCLSQWCRSFRFGALWRYCLDTDKLGGEIPELLTFGAVLDFIGRGVDETIVGVRVP